MDPFLIFPLTIAIVSMTAFWNADNTVPKEVVKSEKRFIVDQSVYQCEQRQTLTTRMPQDYKVEPESRVIYVEKPCPACPKVPVKQRPKPTKLKTECK